MNHVVSFSLGKTSACMSIMTQQMQGVYKCISIMESCLKSGEIQGSVEYILMDTSWEHPLSYDFGRALEKKLGIKITVLRGDFNQDLGEGHSYTVHDLKNITTTPLQGGAFYGMVKKYGVPTVMTPWCTSRMKEETHDKYCDNKYGKGNYVTWLGMRVDEPKRLKNVGKSPLLRYFSEISDMTKADVNDFWSDMDFNLEIPPFLGNCVFCVKKSKNKIALAVRREPELAKQWQKLIDDAPDIKFLTLKKNKDGQIDFVSQASGEPDEIVISAKSAMYRGYRSFGDIIKMFEQWSDQDIEDSIRSMKDGDSDGCGESCEPNLNNQLDWVGE